jgi:hypothetical protein
VAKTSANELVKILREDLQDEHTPYLWSTSELLRYIDGGQIEFCRQGIPIFDSTSEKTLLAVRQGDANVVFDDAILHVRQAIARYQKEVDGPYFYRTLKITTQDNALAQTPHWPRDYGASRRVESQMFSEGEPFEIYLDYDQSLMRLGRIPDRDFEIQTSVERIPWDIVNDCEVEIEVTRMHHPAILAWAAYMAFLRQDSETFDKEAASRFLGQFTDYATRSKDEKLRRHSTPGTVIYGGI